MLITNDYKLNFYKDLSNKTKQRSTMYIIFSNKKRVVAGEALS